MLRENGFSFNGGGENHADMEKDLFLVFETAHVSKL